ncbi:MAG: DUF58 domain-containing protein [Myxococcota bacterium]|nr:DUF58 domain-containing protein [Myxococcota bacterium]
MIEVWPFTPLGLVIGMASWFALVYFGGAKSDFIVRAACIVVFFILAVSLVFVAVGTIWLHSQFRRRASTTFNAQMETDQGLDANTHIPRLRWWPFVQVAIQWRYPDNLELTLKPKGRWLTERIQPKQRGRHAHILRQITIKDIFGLCAVTLTYRRAASLHVTPQATTFEVESTLRTGEGDGYSRPDGQPVGDLVEMRRYGPGDPIKMILWKAYARTRRLLVRNAERAVAPLPSTAAYFIAGPDDEPSASVARTMIESGILGDDLVFSADGNGAPIRSQQDALEAVIESVDHRHRGGADFEAFRRQVDARHLERCILFLPGKSGPWLSRLPALVDSLPQPPTMLMTISGRRMSSESAVNRLLFRPPETNRKFKELPAIYERLKDLGGPVCVIHYREGRILNEREIRQMGAL